MLQGNFNCAKKAFLSLPISSYVPSMWYESRRSFFECPYAVNCWCRLMRIFYFRWVFYGSFSGKVLQILSGPDLEKISSILWCNAVVEIWFERNQRILHGLDLSVSLLLMIGCCCKGLIFWTTFTSSMSFHFSIFWI